MNCTRDQLFACTRLSPDQDRRIRRRYLLDLRQDLTKRMAFPDDLFEVAVRTDFILQIELFFSELILKPFDLAIGHRVVCREGDLLGDLSEQLNVLFRKEVFAHAAYRQGSDDSSPLRHQRHDAR